MSALDVGLLVFLGWQGFRGYRLGLVQSVIKLVGWVLALWLGSQFARSAAVAFSGWIQDPVGQRLAAFVCIVVLVLFMLAGVGLMLRTLVQALALGPAERLLGGAFGLAKGVLMVLLLLGLTGAWLADSRVWQHSQVIQRLWPYAPEVLGQTRQLAGQTWRHWQGVSPAPASSQTPWHD